MDARQRDWLKAHPVEYDPLLINSGLDSRRCIALIAKGSWEWQTQSSIAIDTLLHQYLPYGIRPTLHHTIYNISGWQGYNYDALDKIADAARKTIRQYTVTFDRLIPTRGGLALCGTANQDLNKWRNEMYTNSLSIYAEVPTNIIHSTLYRFTRPFTQTNKWLNDIDATFGSTQPATIATLTVNKIELVETSWLAHPEDTRTLRVISIPK